jgi:DNA-binding response OmpR family regulator
LRIAILEDDREVAVSLKSFLNGSSHVAEIFTTADSLLYALKQRVFDLFLLDWTLPTGLGGFDVLIHLRTNLCLDTPVIFLSAHNEECRVANVLNSGADDYIVKPIRYVEFLARIKSVERRRDGHRIETARFDETIAGYTFSSMFTRVSFNGRDVDLSQREFQLAKLLFSEINRPIPRQKLLLAIWGSTDIENSRSLDVHVSKIRRTLGLSDDRSTARLASIYGFGYRLMEIFPQ